MTSIRFLLGFGSMLAATPLFIETLASSPMHAETRLETGKKAPRFEFFDLDTTIKVKLENLAYRGKEKSWAKKRPVLLDFFRTDCGACVNAMPDLVKLAERIQPKGVDVIVVALLEEEDGENRLRQYLAKDEFPFQVVVDPTGDTSKKYVGDPATLPSAFLIDRNGTIVRIKRDAQGTLESFFGPDLDELITAQESGTDRIHGERR
jgi:peroxiredoxin